MNLKIEKGSFTAIIGQTGSVKSTLIQHINALLLPTSGEIKIDDYIISQNNKPQNLKSLRKKSGLVFQFPEYQLFEETIERDIMFGPMNFGIDENSAKEIAKKSLEMVGLDETYLEKSPFDLSGGQKRMVAIAGILAMDPDILVLDEPTNDLDIDTLNILEDYLDHFEGIIITVSHDRYFLDRICDGLFILQNQHIRYVNGGYSQNLDTSTKEEKEKGQGALAYKQSKQNKIKMTYMEKKEFEGIEDVIMDLETKLNEVEEKMNGVTDFKELDELSKQRDEIQNQIDEKNERYLYLLELQEQIENQ